jgi:hypothetical protein
MNCNNLEEVKIAFEKHKLKLKLKLENRYYSTIFKIYNPDRITLKYIIDECIKDKTIVYTKNHYSGKTYFITKLLKNKYLDYKYFVVKYNFTHYEENVLNSLNKNLITPKISSPWYFDELPKTVLEKRKNDNDNIDQSKRLKIITDDNENVSEKKETINISFKNGKIIRNEKIKEIYNLETNKNEIYIDDLLIGDINNDGNLQLSDTIIKKYTKLEFNVNNEE